MTLSAENLAEIASEVWASLLEDELIPSDTTTTELPVGAEVMIHGESESRVRIETSAALARQLTAKLFEMEEDEVDDELVADAIGELANIIGGNVKALMPTPNRLGLPGPLTDGPTEMVAMIQLLSGTHPFTLKVDRVPGGESAATEDHETTLLGEET